MFFLVAGIGMLSVFRKIRQWEVKWRLDKKAARTLCFLFITFYSLLILFAANTELQAVIILTLALEIVLLFTDFVLHWNHERSFQSEFYAFLQEVTLLMKSGLGFRASIKQALLVKPSSFQKSMEPLLESVFFSQQLKCEPRSFAGWVEREFRWVDQNADRALQNLELFRDQMARYFDFQKKAKRALRQARLQALTLLIVFILLLVVMRVWFSEYFSYQVSSFSLLLALVGFIILWQMGRRIKWKI